MCKLKLVILVWRETSLLVPVVLLKVFILFYLFIAGYCGCVCDSLNSCLHTWNASSCADKVIVILHNIVCPWILFEIVTLSLHIGFPSCTTFCWGRWTLEVELHFSIAHVLNAWFCLFAQIPQIFLPGVPPHLGCHMLRIRLSHSTWQGQNIDFNVVVTNNSKGSCA